MPDTLIKHTTRPEHVQLFMLCTYLDGCGYISMDKPGIDATEAYIAENFLFDAVRDQNVAEPDLEEAINLMVQGGYLEKEVKGSEIYGMKALPSYRLTHATLAFYHAMKAKKGINR